MAERDAFGRLLSDPATLPFAERVDVVRRLAGQLQASRSLDERWLGECLTTWLAGDYTDLVDALALRPSKGSHLTPQTMLRIERRDRALLRLSAAAGGDSAAMRTLAGAPCPVAAREALAEVRALGVPSSRAAFTRARKSVSRHTR